MKRRVKEAFDAGVDEALELFKKGRPIQRKDLAESARRVKERVERVERKERGSSSGRRRR